MSKIQLPAEERSKHPEGKAFKSFFHDLLMSTKTCLERDVLRNSKEDLWNEWKHVMGKYLPKGQEVEEKE